MEQSGRQFACAPDKLTQEQFDNAFFQRFYGCQAGDARAFLRTMGCLIALYSAFQRGSGAMNGVIKRLAPLVKPAQEAHIGLAHHERLTATAQKCLRAAHTEGGERIACMFAYGRSITYPAIRHDLALHFLTTVSAVMRLQEEQPDDAEQAWQRPKGSIHGGQHV